MLTYGDVPVALPLERLEALAYADVCQRMLTYADVPVALPFERLEVISRHFILRLPLSSSSCSIASGVSICTFVLVKRIPLSSCSTASGDSICTFVLLKHVSILLYL
jgi:hypothetical protein